MTNKPPRVLFLCTGNSCRSQMAEGLLRALGGERYESLSAGAKPAGFVHPMAVEAMREIGIDISGQRSKSIHEFLPPQGEPPDRIISVCDSAARECPVFPGEVERLHWPFEDPTHAEGSPEDTLAWVRRVRDEIRATIETQLINDASRLPFRRSDE
ncbi:MAG: arsenate reductase ArsC [Planctomycetaceae bacterium]